MIKPTNMKKLKKRKKFIQIKKIKNVEILKLIIKKQNVEIHMLILKTNFNLKPRKSNLRNILRIIPVSIGLYKPIFYFDTNCEIQLPSDRWPRYRVQIISFDSFFSK